MTRSTAASGAAFHHSAAHLVVRRWIDDTTEQLGGMMYTCSLDVVGDYPDGLAESSVALLLGVTEQAINAETKGALLAWRAALPCDECDAAGGEPCRGTDGLHLRRGRDEIGAVLHELER